MAQCNQPGVLSLGVTALATWLGLTVTPQDLLSQNDFNSGAIVHTGVFLGAFLTVIPFLSERWGLKNFSLTYLNFGVHILMISTLAGMMALGQTLLYFLILCLSVVWHFTCFLFRGCYPPLRYTFSRSHGQTHYAWRHWHGILLVLELLSLITFYAIGNFWVVQQAGLDFFQMEIVPMDNSVVVVQEQIF